MSNQGDDDITIIVGDDELSQNSIESEEEDKFVMIIVKKQQEIRDEMLKLQGKMELLNEMLMEHILEQQEAYDDPEE